MSEPVTLKRLHQENPKDSANNGAISVFVVDEQPIIASGIFSYFSNSREFSVCGQAHSIQDALRGFLRAQPAVIITDLLLRRSDGLAWIKDLTVRHPAVKVVIFTSLDATVYALRAIRAGAHGYISKFDDPTEILKALRAVCRGEVYLPTHQLQDLIRETAQALGNRSELSQRSLESLGNRELHVLKLFGTGHSTIDVARAMHISPKTVQTHRRNIMIKLGITHSTQFVSYAAQWMRERTF